jgi:hypothetical protein
MNDRLSCRRGFLSRAEPRAAAGDANRTVGHLASRAERRAVPRTAAGRARGHPDGADGAGALAGNDQTAAADQAPAGVPGPGGPARETPTRCHTEPATGHLSRWWRGAVLVGRDQTTEADQAPAACQAQAARCAKRGHDATQRENGRRRAPPAAGRWPARVHGHLPAIEEVRRPGRRGGATCGRHSLRRDAGDENENFGFDATQRENGRRRARPAGGRWPARGPAMTAIVEVRPAATEEVRRAGRRGAATCGRHSLRRGAGDENENFGFNAIQRESGGALVGRRGRRRSAPPAGRVGPSDARTTRKTPTADDTSVRSLYLTHQRGGTSRVACGPLTTGD